MNIMIIILGYLKWHYTNAIFSLGKIQNNFFYFITEFFSIKLLVKNFFDPWKKMNYSYPERFNPKEFFYTLMTNLIVRIIGILMRSGLLLISLIICLLFIALYPFIILIWLLLPLIVASLILGGLYLAIFKKIL